MHSLKVQYFVMIKNNNMAAIFMNCLGLAPEIRNYFVAAGMRSNGIASAGGVGTLIADWIVNGRAPFDLYGLDILRCLGMHNNKR
jgi:hypothetical protein